MQSMKANYQDYIKIIEAIDKELDLLPPGSLVKRGKCYTHAVNNKEYAITPDNVLFQGLCRKRFLLELEKKVKRAISLMTYPISKLIEKSNEEIIHSLPASYQGLPKKYFLHHSSVKEWVDAPYEKNPYLREKATLTSNNNVELRSKSEVLIANQLEFFGIPYRSDAAVILGKKKIYADFIALNPYSTKLFLWEHFGALHEKDYIKNMYDKMKLYRDYGHKYFEDIIYTFEPDVEKTDHIRTLIKKRILKSD